MGEEKGRGGELLLGAIDVGVVHVERAHAHEAEQLAALLVAIASAVFREAQWQVAATARFSGKDAVLMRAVPWGKLRKQSGSNQLATR